MSALTRAKTNLSAGVVGLANVGKSSFFQAITQSDIGKPANYPFATIDPEEAKVIVPSPQLARLAQVYKPRAVVPSTLELVDIAGLIRGASKGNGLGNAFLSNIRAVDGMFQLVRAFDDADIVHTENTVDPIRDSQLVTDELILKDMEYVQTAIDATEKSLKKQNDPKLVSFLKTCHKCMDLLNQGKRVGSKSHTFWLEEELAHLRSLSLLSVKPSVFIANISEEDYCFSDQEIPSVKELQKWVDEYYPGSLVIPVSVNFEFRRSKMTAGQREAEDAELGADITKSSLPEATFAMRRALGLHSFYTAGRGECREWTIKVGTKAPQAAGVIHTDLEKTFINAKIYKMSTIESHVSDIHDQKTIPHELRGRDYIMEDGDIVEFKAVGSRK